MERIFNIIPARFGRVHSIGGREQFTNNQNNIKTMEKNLFNPENPELDATCLGEICFLRKKLWKMALMLGFDFSKMDGLTSRGFTFSTITNPDEYIKPVTDFCEKYGIKYRIEYSQNHWQKLVIVSQSKKVLEKLDALYIDFYKANITA